MILTGWALIREKHAVFIDKAEEQSCIPSLQFQGCTYFLTKLQWEADLLLCVLLNVSHLAGGSTLGPLKQKHSDGEGWKIRCQCLTIPTGTLTRTCIKRHILSSSTLPPRSS